MNETAFSAASVMSDLMDFQKRTVNYAFRRLFTASDSTDRFLVADEVGLGKTMVARGIAARTIEHPNVQAIRHKPIPLFYPAFKFIRLRLDNMNPWNLA